MNDEKMFPFWRARDALMSLHKALVEFHSSSLGNDWRCLRVKKHIDAAIKVLEDEAEAEEKSEEPPVLIYNDAVNYNDAVKKHPCPQCGQDCPEDLISGQYFCRTHGSFLPKSGSGEAFKETPRCLKCGAEAPIHRDLFAAGDEWACCEKCKVMFRVKPEPEEVEK